MWVAGMISPVWDGTGRDPWLPARLEARLKIAETEEDIRSAVWAALQGWLVSVARRVLRNERPDPDAVFALVPAWREVVHAIVRGQVLKAVGLAFVRMFGPGYSYDQRAFITAYLAEVENRLVRVADEVYDLVASEMAVGVNLGEGVDKLAARVDSVLSTTGSERWPNRAVVVARTEAIGAMNAGRFEAFRVFASEEDGELEQMWLCVLPGTPVLATGVSQVARRWYDGQVRHLGTASGRRVSLTPQHPVLTARGWVQAQRLHLGDQLLSVPGVDPIGAPGVEGRYALIEECFDAAAEGREVRTLTREVPSGVDLDGDLVNEEVQVVSAHGDLVQGLESGTAQDLGRLGLELPDKAFARLVVQRPVSHGGFGDKCPSCGGLTAGPNVPFNLVRSPGSEDSSLALVTSLDTSDAQDSSDGVAAGTVGDSEAVDRGPALVVADDLVSIEVSTWSGHVYDFSTYCQWFLADGIVVHNSTDDSRTRHTHRDAEGQRVPIGEAFTVGGFSLRFPGDPSGPPQEIIQCRCTSLLVERGESVDLSDRQLR